MPPRSTWGFRVLGIAAGLLALGVALGLGSVIAQATAAKVSGLDPHATGGDLQALIESRTDHMRLAMRFVDGAQLLGAIGCIVAIVGCAGLVGGRPRWTIALVGAAVGLLVRILVSALHFDRSLLGGDGLGRWAPVLLGALVHLLLGIGFAIPPELGKVGRVAGVMLAASAIVFTAGRLIATRSAILGALSASIALGVFAVVAIACFRARDA